MSPSLSVSTSSADAPPTEGAGECARKRRMSKWKRGKGCGRANRRWGTGTPQRAQGRWEPDAPRGPRRPAPRRLVFKGAAQMGGTRGREDLPARLSEPGGPAGVQGLSVGPAPQTSLCI